MPIFYLFAASPTTNGTAFTPAGFQSQVGSFASAQSITDLADETTEAGSVQKSKTDAARFLGRRAGYTPQGNNSGAASEYFDELLIYNTDGNLQTIRRDVLTGNLQVDGSFINPTGTVTSFMRYEGLTADRSSINALFKAEEGNWSAQIFRPGEGSGFHALLTAGDDTVIGSAANDSIDAGPGVNYVFGKEGADSFYIYRGRSSKTFTKKQSNQGLQVSKQTRPARYTYDKDVILIQDFDPQSDQLFIQGKPASYQYQKSDGNTLIFADKKQQNLVAVLVGATGIDASNFLSF